MAIRRGHLTNDLLSSGLFNYHTVFQWGETAMLSFPTRMPASWKLPPCSQWLAPYQADHVVLTEPKTQICLMQKLSEPHTSLHYL